MELVDEIRAQCVQTIVVDECMERVGQEGKLQPKYIQTTMLGWYGNYTGL